MKNQISLRIIIVFLFILGSISGCVIFQSFSIPPSSPFPLSSFSVKFVPSVENRFPPTDEKEVKRFKNVLHWPGSEDMILGNESPTRPYIEIGELRFKKSWYYLSNITELINMHVPKVGGNAVLVYHAYQTKSAMMKNPNSGKFVDVYYQSMVLKVIRYTD